MSLFLATVQLQLELFLLMLIGFVAMKLGLITPSAQRSFSDILIYVVLPCNIINSFTSGVDVSPSLLQNCALAFLFSFVIQMFATYASKWLFRSWPQEKGRVASYGLIVSNSSFIGIPVAEHLYGALGVLYTAVFQIPVRFTMWSAGLALFTSVDAKEAFKNVVTHPCILACVAGFVMMLAHFSLPGFMGDAVTALSRCTVPFSMLVIGAILANGKQLLRADVLLFCLYRLILFPLLVLAILRLLHANDVLSGVTVLLTAMPAGSTTAILPQKYNCDAAYGAALIFMSTLLSIATIPLLSFLNAAFL
jgi:predicted permease